MVLFFLSTDTVQSVTNVDVTNPFWGYVRKKGEGKIKLQLVHSKAVIQNMQANKQKTPQTNFLKHSAG